jgi:hypothetical protein
LAQKSENNINKVVLLGQIPDEIAEKLLTDYDLEVLGFNFSIDVYAIKHILKSHGNVEKELKRGQKSVTTEDIKMIPEIINQPDVVFYDGKNRLGLDVIQFQKMIGDHYLIVKEIRTGKKMLALNSMRIIKTKKNRGVPSSS